MCASILPIDKPEWDQGRSWDTLEGQVYLYLKKNIGKAFTQSEIVSGLSRLSPINDIWTFLTYALSSWSVGNALGTLIKEGKVKAKLVETRTGEEVYYMAA